MRCGWWLAAPPLVQQQPGGSMLAVRLVPEEQVKPLLNGCLAIAAINSPSLCVVSGPTGKHRAPGKTAAAGSV